MRRSDLGRWSAILVAALGLLVSCGIQVEPGGSGNTCVGTYCPPPARSAVAGHIYRAQHFSFEYFDPWQITSSDPSSAQVSAATNYGDLTVLFTSTTVAPGTSPQTLLTSAVNSLDTGQFAGLQAQGPIYGAAIGYIAGTGETYTATADQPNAPNVPVYLEIMASIDGTTGIVFVSSSVLNPNGPDPVDPRQVPNGEYDQMVNSVTWF
jgi:hypothetical protein